MRLPDILKQDWSGRSKQHTQADFARKVQAVAQLPEPPKANTVSAWFNGPNVPRPEMVEPIRMVLGYPIAGAKARQLRAACALPRAVRAASAAVEAGA